MRPLQVLARGLRLCGRSSGARRQRGDALGPQRRRCEHHDVEALRARVENGYLVLKVPTTLPEGEEVCLVVVDDEDMTAEGRAELAAALEEAERDIDAGWGASITLWLLRGARRLAKISEGLAGPVFIGATPDATLASSGQSGREAKA